MNYALLTLSVVAAAALEPARMVNQAGTYPAAGGLAFDGKTTGPEAAAAIVAAERAKNETQARAHADDAPNKAPAGGAPSDVKKTDAEKANEATALAAAEGISVVAALKKLGYAA